MYVNLSVLIYCCCFPCVWMKISSRLCLCSGRIRNTPEPEEEDNDSSVLSLGLFPGEYLEIPGDDRCMFRFEAAWDSSLHNSVLLNRVTSYGEQIFMTISAYVEVNTADLVDISRYSLPRIFLHIIIILLKWHSSPIWTLTSLMDFSQLALLFDLSFQFVISYLWISGCMQFHHLFFGCSLLRILWASSLNTWLNFCFTIHSVNITNPIQWTYSDKWKNI